MHRLVYGFVFLLGLLLSTGVAAQKMIIRGTIYSADTALPLNEVSVYLPKFAQTRTTNNNGEYNFEPMQIGSYEMILFADGYSTRSVVIDGTQAAGPFDFRMDSLGMDLTAIEVEADRRENFGLRRLNNVEGMAIYAAKKSEVIEFKNIVANLATNNPRQVYKNIAGLNIWESDGAGLQLSIGARGLDPNRTSNFNTRQNGYDISADALGYPESYYTPPTQALRRIEIVRGAASLQYGSQFGGLLNFVMKKGQTNKKFVLASEQTVGSFGLFNSFNSIGGEKNGWNYYGYFQYKRGEGWRANSEFEQKGAYFQLSKKMGKKFSIGLEYTHMDYLAKQPGGLEDFEFNTTPALSKRERNWFQVDWNLFALNLDYKISERTKLNSRSFYLDAQREALGALNPINRPDPLTDRDLIRGQFNNIGNETRIIHRYTFNKQITTFLAGVRLYKGFTQNEQGFANDGIGPEFQFLQPDNLEQSDYEFPSANLALFAENLFYVLPKWSITPGLRWEWIKTSSDGFFKERVISGDSTLLEIKVEDQKINKRSFLLLGLGTGYKLTEELEAYANFSQNYRSINFSDLALVNPNLIIDSLLTDEQGYNLDLGIRGNLLKNALRLDFSFFYLNYKNRIGTSELIIFDPIVVEKAVAFRTNVGNAYVLGIESYIEADLIKLFKREWNDWQANVFLNGSLLKSEYKTDDQKINGNEVELVPRLTIKTGLNIKYKKIRGSYQFSRVGDHFSDATNATFVADATRGIIPGYNVHDLSLSFATKRLKFQTGINNLFDARYFTRRAQAYPGPGIIPADARNFYLTLSVKIIDR